MNFMEWILSPKGSTVFVFLLSILISILTSVTQRLLINVKQMAIWRKEITDWTREYTRAQKENDKKALAKLKKKEKYIMDLQKKTMWISMRPSLLFFIPFLLIWQLVLIPLYGAKEVAYFPGLGGQNIVIWYMICSFMSGILLQKALGLTMEVTEDAKAVTEDKK